MTVGTFIYSTLIDNIVLDFKQTKKKWSFSLIFFLFSFFLLSSKLNHG